MPVISWDDVPDYSESLTPLSFIPDNFDHETRNRLMAWDASSGAAQNVVEEARAILRGEFVLFSSRKESLGFPPDWHRNVMSGAYYDNNLHWSKISDFGHGDIKCVWEASRFSWAYTLARAYARTGDESFAEGFWQLFENWLDENPPNAGVNWKCGQEATFRLMAAAFARKVFADARATSSQRLVCWRKFVAFTASRIADNLAYALSQNNNHGISECIGLYTAVRMLPQLPKAKAWLAIAESSLIAQLEQLVYSDGGFSQHSTVYHRVVMHDLIWLLAFEKAQGTVLDSRILAAARKTLRFMAGITDLKTGMAPLHGFNDGANVLPLTSSDYLDMRPAIVALAALLSENMPIAPGLHDEATFWLSLCESRGGQSINKDFFAEASGWFIVAGEDSRAFCYAPTVFRHRPAQADLLHCDVWWRGIAITRDPGSFSYNAQGQFATMLNSTAVHNTVGVDGKDQFTRVSRFLYLPWPAASVTWHSEKRELIASHDAYKNLGVRHNRLIKCCPGDKWLIEDNLVIDQLPGKSREIRLHWLLADHPYSFEQNELKVILHTSAGDYSLQIKADSSISKTDLVRADTNSDRGWWSPFYYRAEPALSLQLTLNACKDVKIVSIFQPVAIEK